MTATLHHEMKKRLTSQAILALYERNCKAAAQRLKQMPIFCGAEPEFRGLTGWVFEKTILYCLIKELRGAGVRIDISEQLKLGTRARFDLQLGRVLVEIKRSGFFSGDATEKYHRYRKLAAAQGYTYLFLSGQETHAPYRKLACQTFGIRNTFYLDKTSDWRRFVKRVLDLLGRNKAKRVTKKPTTRFARG